MMAATVPMVHPKFLVPLPLEQKTKFQWLQRANWSGYNVQNPTIRTWGPVSSSGNWRAKYKQKKHNEIDSICICCHSTNIVSPHEKCNCDKHEEKEWRLRAGLRESQGMWKRQWLLWLQSWQLWHSRESQSSRWHERTMGVTCVYVLYVWDIELDQLRSQAKQLSCP